MVYKINDLDLANAVTIAILLSLHFRSLISRGSYLYYTETGVRV